MRSLNTSLPSSHTNQPQPPEQLLQAFRTAALSVTNLFKSAVKDQSNSRQEGYQDALDDLLAFLDKENLGLQDGEGWRVRQWATERYDRASIGAHQNDSDDEQNEQERRPRSTSPNVARPPEDTSQAPNVAQPSEVTSQAQEQSQPDIAASLENSSSSNDNTSESTERPTMFRFTGGTPSQQDIPMQLEDGSSATQSESDGSTINTAPTPLRVEVVHRGSRNPHRHGSPRHGTRPSAREFTFSHGTKRKLQFPDFFDISNLGSGRDREGNGGGKRGRYA
jgi:Domain of unknown function (DUF4588)